MQTQFSSRAFAAADYDAVVALWERTEGVEVAEGDDRTTITAYLQRHPGLSRVAEVNGKIVGAVLCGHDGRRGVLYHLAVAPEHRGKGVGRKLVEECLAGLGALGLKRALIMVAKDNAAGREFWVARGFENIDAQPMGVDVELC